MAAASTPTRFRVLGTGRHAVLCLHGWFGHGGDWGPWEGFLDTGSYSWIFPDYRGYGSRREEAGEFTLDEIAGDLIAYLDNETGKGFHTLTVLGHSMGGVFAQYLLMQVGDRVDAFIGVSPVAASGSPMPSEQRGLFESAETEVGSRRAIIDITTGQRLSPRWSSRLAQGTRITSTDEAVGAYFRTWADCDFQDELGSWRIPALAIVGAHDPAVTAQGVRETLGVAFPELQVVEFSDAGHYTMFESPVRLATEVENFLTARVVT